MGYSLQIDIDDEEMFIKCVNALMSRTGVLKEKDSKIFSFLRRNRNLTAVQDYFAAAGWNVILDESLGVAMRIPREELIADAGTLRAAKIPLNKNDIIILLVLNQSFSANLLVSDENMISQSELISRISGYGFDIPRRELKNSLLKFKKERLIWFNEKEIADDKMRIDLYGTLRLGIDAEMLRHTLDEFLDGADGVEEEEEEYCGEE